MGTASPVSMRWCIKVVLSCTIPGVNTSLYSCTNLSISSSLLGPNFRIPVVIFNMGSGSCFIFPVFVISLNLCIPGSSFLSEVGIRTIMTGHLVGPIRSRGPAGSSPGAVNNCTPGGNCLIISSCSITVGNQGAEGHHGRTSTALVVKGLAVKHARQCSTMLLIKEKGGLQYTLMWVQFCIKQSVSLDQYKGS
eukprot:jgi/Botrbrau1/9916/Bobra.0012s0016.1